MSTETVSLDRLLKARNDLRTILTRWDSEEYSEIAFDASQEKRMLREALLLADSLWDALLSKVAVEDELMESFGGVVWRIRNIADMRQTEEHHGRQYAQGMRRAANLLADKLVDRRKK